MHSEVLFRRIEEGRTLGVRTLNPRELDMKGQAARSEWCIATW